MGYSLVKMRLVNTGALFPNVYFGVSVAWDTVLQYCAVHTVASDAKRCVACVCVREPTIMVAVNVF